MVTIKYTLTKYEHERDSYYAKSRPPSCALLFDDPSGDVVFVFSEGGGPETRIYAHKKILSAVSEYYRTSELTTQDVLPSLLKMALAVLSSDFSEGPSGDSSMPGRAPEISDPSPYKLEEVGLHNLLRYTDDNKM